METLLFFSIVTIHITLMPCKAAYGQYKYTGIDLKDTLPIARIDVVTKGFVVNYDARIIKCISLHLLESTRFRFSEYWPDREMLAFRTIWGRYLMNSLLLCKLLAACLDIICDRRNPGRSQASGGTDIKSRSRRISTGWTTWYSRAWHEIRFIPRFK